MLTPYRLLAMKFQVDDIELDFETEGGVFPIESQIIVHEGCIGMWEADNEEDLIEEVTACTGWCVKNIDYRILLNELS